jgi:hypothetical protein
VVWATDPETDREGPRPVLAVWVHEDVLIDLELDDGGRVSTTVDHPFWNHTAEQWQRADTLDAGDELLTPYGSTVTVVGLDDTTARTGDAYNLTIANHRQHPDLLRDGRRHGSLALLGIMVGVGTPAVGLLTVGGVSGQLLVIGAAGIAAGLTWLLAGAVCWQIRQVCQSSVCEGTVREAGSFDPFPRQDPAKPLGDAK